MLSLISLYTYSRCLQVFVNTMKDLYAYFYTLSQLDLSGGSPCPMISPDMNTSTLSENKFIQSLVLIDTIFSHRYTLKMNIKISIINKNSTIFIFFPFDVFGQLRSSDQSSLPTQFLQTNNPFGSTAFLIDFS